MSIIIDGIRIPQDREITLRIDEKGEVYVYDTYPTELHKAIEVPDNHGDLIDKQELLFELGSEHIGGIDAIRNAKTWRNDWTSGLHTAWRTIDDAPTVIPSSNT